MNWLMIGSLWIGLCGIGTNSEEPLRTFSWKELQAAGRLSAGTVVKGDVLGSPEQLKVENPKDGRASLAVLTVDEPGVTRSCYAVAGEVRCEDVEGQGYLEMWSSFPDGGRFFSRTLGDGLMMPLEGTCQWRSFLLPFTLGDRSDKPSRLVVNVVLPGKGTVYLGPLRLVQYPNGLPMILDANRLGAAMGVAGGLLGALLGCMGAAIGVLSALGRARGLVFAMIYAGLALGAVLLVAGTVALVQGLPYAIYFPLLLVGGLCLAILEPARRSTKKRYELVELKKMASLDLSAR